MANLSLYFNTPLDNALNLPVSIAEKVLKTKAFDGWKQYREYEAKTQNAIIESINGVIKGQNNLAKMLSRR